MDSETLNDDYEHLDSGVFYTPVNIPGPGVDVNVSFAEQFEGCECVGNCFEDKCKCIRGGNPIYDESGRFADPDHPPDLIYECHVNCRCDSNCINRVVQKGPHRELEIIDAGTKGRGLYCKVDLLKGVFVCEYAGEVIGPEEARKRYSVQKNLGRPNYIFALREHFGNDSCPVLTTYIDPTWIGNIGRYINHSCDPNLVVVPVRMDTVVPKLCLFARRDIPSFTELTFDYAGGMESVSEEHGGCSDRIACRCMSPICRRFLPFDYSL